MIVAVMGKRPDRAPLFRETLGCIQRQTFKDYELIVVEQYVDDPLWESEVSKLASRYVPIKGTPFCNAWCKNVGARLAGGSTLLILDGDLVFGENYLQFVMERFESAEKYSAGASRVMFLSRSAAREYRSAHVYRNDWGRERLQWDLPIGIVRGTTTGPLVFDRDYFLNCVGGYNENYELWAAEDRDVLVRAVALMGDSEPRTMEYVVLHLWHGLREKMSRREVRCMFEHTVQDPLGVSKRLVEVGTGDPRHRSLIEVPRT